MRSSINGFCLLRCMSREVARSGHRVCIAAAEECGIAEGSRGIDPDIYVTTSGTLIRSPLVTTMQSNVGNYNSVNSLPNFRLFTWFFVLPGLLMFGLSGWGLFFSGQHRLTFLHRHPHVPMAGAAH